MKKGTKHDKGKPIITLLDPEFLIQMTRIMEYGVITYERGNWQLDLDPDRILNALMRHALKIQQGEIIDKDSKLPHSAHIACNAMFLNYYERHGKPVKTEHNKG